MKQYVNLPIDQLISDVAVDPVHVKELADSIMTKGQLAPIIIREETREVIDGFHRIAAMKELGFDQVECVLTPCDDEGFWDFRIIQASLHKNVTFARAIDWIERVFETSSLKKHWEHGGAREYKSAYSVFASYKRGNPPKEVKEWVEAKSAIWGLKPKTVEVWLYTKQSLSPDLLQEALSPSGGERGLSTYETIAEVLPTKPELQKRLVEKAKTEDLSTKDVKIVAQALRQTEDEEVIESILERPVSLTEKEIVRGAKAEHLVLPTEKEYKEKLGVGVTPADEILTLTDQIQQLNEMLEPEAYDWQGGRGLISHVLTGLYALLDKATKMIQFLEKQGH